MRWEQDALDAVRKAPAFLRSMIKRKVESHAASRGASVVTLDLVDDARRRARPETPLRDGAAAGPEPAGVAISSEEIERVVAATPRSAVLSQSRFYEVKVCGGAFGCPRALFDVRAVADKITVVIEESGVAEAVASRVSGPILRHHKFSVAIAGCPNSCSQPQINDFGVQGRARVTLGPGPCTDCRECVRVCGEGSMRVDDAVPEIDRGKCIDCGDCAAVCPTEALVVEERGYTILAGGKLGRHPQLARELAAFADEDGFTAALRVCLGVFVNEMQPGERVADAVTRIGMENLLDRISRSNL
ncbi:MAG: 4Fe-4S binding protein [Armatimonadota bacterium]|nr:4Fe-4S binding protein [Armatimonadota bacterium]